MAKPAAHFDTRQQLLQAGLKHFANSGYAATSVQGIVDDAKLSKPALYYHFKDKAGLFQALVHEAHDARHQLVRTAVEGRQGIGEQMEAALAALFGYFRENRELMRISMATMFAAPGEMPEDSVCLEKCHRNFEFVHSLIQTAQAKGELDPDFDSRELAFGIYGLANFYLVGHLVSAECQPDELTAKRIVKLFLAGAGPKSGAPHSKQTTKRRK